MKKILLSLVALATLSFGVSNYAQAQTSAFIGTWVLQNPEAASLCAVVSFYSNGVVTQTCQNILTQEPSSSQSSWSYNSATRILTITDRDGSSYSGKVLPLTNSFELYNGNVTDFVFAKPGTSQDNYVANAKMAINLYGNDASLKKGFPTSSRATGYSTQPRTTTCSSCFGLGRCIQCNGLGSITFDYREYKTCPSCGGTGKCWQCHGTGKLNNY